MIDVGWAQHGMNDFDVVRDGSNMMFVPYTMMVFLPMSLVLLADILGPDLSMLMVNARMKKTHCSDEGCGQHKALDDECFGWNADRSCQ
mmetsp:Transcript_22420/g.29622  ORF Transcript_22420/g.29622 Transcript_22420/m.29622 type:complete len:89 (+) Transcript_22420:395-661(+)